MIEITNASGWSVLAANLFDGEKEQPCGTVLARVTPPTPEGSTSFVVASIEQAGDDDWWHVVDVHSYDSRQAAAERYTQTVGWRLPARPQLLGLFVDIDGEPEQVGVDYAILFCFPTARTAAAAKALLLAWQEWQRRQAVGGPNHEATKQAYERFIAVRNLVAEQGGGR